MVTSRGPYSGYNPYGCSCDDGFRARRRDGLSTTRETGQGDGDKQATGWRGRGMGEGGGEGEGEG